MATRKRIRTPDEIAQQLHPLLDRDFYLAKYPDITATKLDPLLHYARFGLNEGRDPNPFFDGAWYRAQNPDVAASGMDPLLHYLSTGAAELRNPHPRFDAAYYVEEHSEAAGNPLVFHMVRGRHLGFATEPPFDRAAFLPSRAKLPRPPGKLRVDIVIPCYRGLAETRRCLDSVLADADRPAGRVLVIDDASPEPALSAYLDQLSRSRCIVLLRNARNLGFVGSANRGIEAAGRADVALLNSDTVVPRGWLARLSAHAYAEPRIASVSPWSNNATICSYPGISGGDPAFGLGVDALDAAAQAANAGRHVPVPVTVGFCMYIRRATLDEVGGFDEAAFGRGYGEECDFCLRATAHGWRHLLACDTYVHHESEVSFGAGANAGRAAGAAVLAARWPDFEARVERHVLRGVVEPFRFALTVELYRRAGLPVILLVTHALGGGVERHIDQLANELRGRANLLVIRPSTRGALISAPSLVGHGNAAIPADRTEALLAALASAGVRRVHVHHVLGADFDLRALIAGLRVPFDLTIHDWFLICPQVNLLPRLDGQYCGEPDQAGCNACIAGRPNNAAREILDWRTGYAWLLREADRILCPSEDARARIARHGFGARAVLAPHEPAHGGPWQFVRPKLRPDEPLRIALIGVLAAQKGLPAVRAFAEAADPTRFALTLIGYPEAKLPPDLRRRIKVTGLYEEADLPALIAKAKPHVIWFPAQWPETWSYTLSAALEASLPVVASRIGAFPERLAGRDLTWLVDPDASSELWIAAFEAARNALLGKPEKSGGPRRELTAFYPDIYLDPLRAAASRPAEPRSRPLVIVVPERFETTDMPTPCAYIRLLQPLSHPAAAAGIDLIVARPAQALEMRADLLVTQRSALPDGESAAALVRHCREGGMRLVYDLDDDLLNVPRDHADSQMFRNRAAGIRRLLIGADTVWVSTQGLADRLCKVRCNARVVPNAIDERLWLPNRARPATHGPGPFRILLMGTATHDADFALIEPALERLRRRYGDWLSVDMVGVSSRDDVLPWINRMSPPGVGAFSYPGFVDWITRVPLWNIGLAPLTEGAFNASKSALKALDYAALGMAVLASDMPSYRGSLADGPGGWLVRNDPDAWYEAIDRMVRLDRTRRELMAAGHASLLANWTLAARAGERQAALREALAAPSPAAPGEGSSDYSPADARIRSASR